jgi:hypothetical protein
VTDDARYLQTSLQVVPASHACASRSLHCHVQALPPPQLMVHAAVPLHCALHPPVGHWMLQFELPVHVSVEPGPIEMLASAPPPTVTLLSGPVSSEQLLVPVQVETQSAAHAPTHADWPPQVVVQPVPHVTLQVLFVSQLYVTLLAAVAASVTPVPPSPAPKVHVPFCAHAQTLPSHWQSPVQLT